MHGGRVFTVSCVFHQELIKNTICATVNVSDRTSIYITAIKAHVRYQFIYLSAWKETCSCQICFVHVQTQAKSILKIQYNKQRFMLSHSDHYIHLNHKQSVQFAITYHVLYTRILSTFYIQISTLIIQYNSNTSCTMNISDNKIIIPTRKL